MEDSTASDIQRKLSCVESDEKFVNLAVTEKNYRIPKTDLISAAPQTSSSEKDSEAHLSILTTFADLSTKFYEKIELSDGYFHESNEFFFERSSSVLDAILELHTTGKLHCPPELCPVRFVKELLLWEVDPKHISSCCRVKEGIDLVEYGGRLKEKKREKVEGTNNATSTDTDTNTTHTNTNQERNGHLLGGNPHQADKSPERDQFSGLFMEKFRRSLWKLMEDPTSSVFAKIFSMWSVGVVLVSVLTLILGSMHVFQVHEERNITADSQLEDEGPKEARPHIVLEVIETGCIIWFTIEYFGRLIVAGDRIAFVKLPLNVIDIVSIAPFYLELTLSIAGISTENLQNLKGALMVLRILRVLRVARIFKVAKYSQGLQKFALTFQASIKELGMIVVFLSVTIVLFSTMLYFMEKDVEDTPFSSIPATFWWCVITMTTVGYGDMTPESIGGKLVASFASISGVLVLAFPIMVIVENFNKIRVGDGDSTNRSGSTDLSPRSRRHQRANRSWDKHRRRPSSSRHTSRSRTVRFSPTKSRSRKKRDWESELDEEWEYEWTSKRREVVEQYQMGQVEKRDGKPKAL